MGRSRGSGGPSGILLVDKADGPSSAQVVAMVRRWLNGPKVGHLGTLDPLATGLLPLCVGEATKIARYLNLADKSYQGVIRLGAATDTDDCKGKVIFEGPVPDLAQVEWSAHMAAFSGEVEQTPPQFSAIKKNGRPMYELARQGKAVSVEPRKVRVDRLVLKAQGPSLVWVDMDCSKGTYVRSLARDLGERLGCGGHLESLRRVKFGSFRVQEAVDLQRLENEGEGDALRSALIPLVDVLADLRIFEVDKPTASDLRKGRQQALFGLKPPAHEGEHARIAHDRSLVAVVVGKSGMWSLERVFSLEAQLDA